MKSILFIIRNEYHLYSTLCMYYKYFNTENFDFKLIIVKRFQNERIEEHYELPFEYFVFEDYLNYQDMRRVKKYPDYEKKIHDIFTHVDEFYTYFDFSFLITIIVNKLKKKSSTKFFLMQEGVGGYYDLVFNRWLIRRSLKSLVSYLYIKYYRKIKNINFVYRWGGYKKIDVLKTFYPDKIKKHIKAKPINLDINIDSDLNSKIKDIFKFYLRFSPSEKYFLYLPIGDSGDSSLAKQKEFDLIDKLLKLSIENGFKFIIKIKSGVASSSYIDRYNDKAIIISAKIPAEIIISDIYNSIIVSAFSSSAMHNVNNNKYFWVYPLLDYQTNLIPFTKDINLVKSYSELEQWIN